MLPDNLRDVVGRGKECVQHLWVRRHQLPLLSCQHLIWLCRQRCCHWEEAGALAAINRGPLKRARSYLPRISFSFLIYYTHVGSTLHRTRLFSKSPSFFGRALWLQHGSIRNTCNTTSTDCMTWSPQDLVDRTEGQDLEEKTKLFLGKKEEKFHVPLEHLFTYIILFLHTLQERRNDETLA